MGENIRMGTNLNAQTSLVELGVLNRKAGCVVLGRITYILFGRIVAVVESYVGGVVIVVKLKS